MNNNMNKYRLTGMICTAAIAAVCFYAYFSGKEDSYAVVFAVTAVLFAISATAELLASRASGAAGALGYFRPAFFYVLAAAALAASLYLFIAG